MTMSTMRDEAHDYLSDAVALRRQLHQWPELGNDLPITREAVLSSLEGLPLDLKLRGRTGKYILKRAMGQLLPEPIIARPKKGFGMPVARWIKGELRTLVRDTLAPDRLRRQGLFNPDYVGRLLTEHESGQADHRKLIWTLLMFEMWPLGKK